MKALSRCLGQRLWTKESAASKKLDGSGFFAQACLLARRLVERGVRMIQIYTGNGQLKDDHGNAKDHEGKAKQVNQPNAALWMDLKQRGLLDSTLVLWGGEFGRTPTGEGAQRRRPQQPRFPWEASGRRHQRGSSGSGRDRRIWLCRGRAR